MKKIKLDYGHGLEEEILRKMSYDPLTGEITWRKIEHSLSNGDKIFNGRYSGKRAGTPHIQDGYNHIGIGGRMILAHRLAWFIYYDEWPDGIIDHINHDRLDNRIVNLRDSNSKEQTYNQSLYRNNTSGQVGVNFSKSSNKWQARIWHGSKAYHLGLFETYEDAVEARKVAEKELGFHANHGNVRGV